MGGAKRRENELGNSREDGVLAEGLENEWMTGRIEGRRGGGGRKEETTGRNEWEEAG